MATQLENQEKLNYVNTQIDEMKKIIWRNEVDTKISESIDWSEDEQADANLKIRSNKKINSTLEKSIDALENIRNELKK